MTTEPADFDLLQRLRAGDEEAFAVLYRRWQGRLFRFAMRMCGSQALAEDATHEVFMALMDGGNGFDPGLGPLAPYLYGMARNQVRRGLSRERAQAAPAEVPEPVAPAADDPQALLAAREAVDALRGALLTLPEHYREAVALCDLEQLSYEDAAEALGCAVGTIRSRLHRGREILAERLRTSAMRSGSGSRRAASGASRPFGASPPNPQGGQR
jgi:RNA polymerase sigma-70 factor (ECF subfamily)